jgi:hypothetical protein
MSWFTVNWNFGWRASASGEGRPIRTVAASYRESLWHGGPIPKKGRTGGGVEAHRPFFGLGAPERRSGCSSAEPYAKRNLALRIVWGKKALAQLKSWGITAPSNIPWN